MKTLRYQGPSHVRSISDSEAQSVGLPPEGFQVSRGEMVNVNDEMAAFLIANYPSDWVAIEDGYTIEFAPVESAPTVEVAFTEEADSGGAGKEVEAAPVDAPPKARGRAREA